MIARRLAPAALISGCLFMGSTFGSADFADKEAANALAAVAIAGRETMRATGGEGLFPSTDTRSAAVQKYIAVYMGRNRGRMQAALDRLELYRPLVLKGLRDGGLPEDLAYLPLLESEYTPGAVSPAGAVGLWQFMAVTARCYGLKVNYWLDERKDPARATVAAARLLKDLHDWFDDWPLALAAYNRGLYGIERDLARARSADYSVLSRRKGMPDETREYVPNLVACILIGRNPEVYGFKVNAYRLPDTEEVVLDRPLDLAIAARCADTTERTLRDMNPALRLWCTPKSGAPTTLRIPVGAKEKFLERLARLKDWTPPHDVLLAQR